MNAKKANKSKAIIVDNGTAFHIQDKNEAH